VLKISYQLKQVRERIQKGLVDKGLLSTSKTNFLLFDMATHPTTPLGISLKSSIITRINALLFAKSVSIPQAALMDEGTQCRVLRAVALAVASYAASVLENALGQGRAGAVLGFEEREEAFQRCDDILQAFSVVPFVTPSAAASSARRRTTRPSVPTTTEQEATAELTREAMKEIQAEGGDSWELYAEVVGAVFEVWGRMDSIL